MVLLGAVVPSSAIVESLRGSGAASEPMLVLGAQLLRGLVFLSGLYVMAVARLHAWLGGAPPLRPAAPGSRTPTHSAEWLLMSALVLVAAVLRFHRLDDGLWIDEILTLVESVRPPLGQIVSSYPSQNHHILFSVLAKLAVLATGESAWALRLPAAVFGVATLVAAWRFGRLVAGERAGLLTATVLAFSYQHIWFSQNARGYALLLFWTIVSSHFLVRGLREGRHTVWLAYAVSVALGMYTHMTMIFAVAGHLCLYAMALRSAPVLSWRSGVTPLLVGFVPSGLLTLLLYAPLLPQIPAASAADSSDVAEWRSPIWLVAELVRGAQAGPLTSLVAVGGILLLAAAAASYWRRRDWSVLVLFAVPSVLGAATMMALGHHLWPRFFLFVAAFLILIVIEGAIEITARVGAVAGVAPARATTLATAGILLMVLFLGRTLPAVYGPKQDYGGARALVEQEWRPGDAVVTVGQSATAFRLFVAPQWGTIATLGDLDRVRASHKRTWLVYTMPVEIENNYPDILRVAQREFVVIGVFPGTLRDGEIFVYRADSTAQGPSTGAGR
jgi:mannosyltransferase